jgi:hypothetical protein
MTLEDIRHDALTNKDQLEIMWDKLDSNPEYEDEFKFSLETVTETIPELESIYMKLTSGKNVTFPAPYRTALSYDEIEMYTELVADELFAAYQMADLYDRYKKVKDVIKS